MHIAHQVGAPQRQEGYANINPPFKRGHSMQHGRKLTSWSDYHRANREMGLVDTGEMKAPDPVIPDQIDTGKQMTRVD